MADVVISRDAEDYDFQLLDNDSLLDGGKIEWDSEK